MTDKPNYMVTQERKRDWRVWSVGPYGGDRKDCVAMLTTRNAALAHCRKLNNG